MINLLRTRWRQGADGPGRIYRSDLPTREMAPARRLLKLEPIQEVELGELVKAELERDCAAAHSRNSRDRLVP